MLCYVNAYWRLGATAREVNMREGREGRREWLRLVVRAWREQADNRRAGAAQWETRWREGRVGVLSRREVSGVEWTVGQYSTLVLEYARLVRGGVIEAARRATSARERAAEAAARFAHGVKRVWAGEHGEGREASLDSWVESAGTRTRQRGELQIVEIFARHGPPVAAHSAAEAAKERSAAGRQQVVRYDPGRASVARAAGKRPAAGVQGAGGSPSKRRVMGSSAGGSNSAADAGDRGMAVGGGEHGPSEAAAVTPRAEEQGLETLASGSSVERSEGGLSGGEDKDKAQRGVGTSRDEHGGGQGMTAGSTAAPRVDMAMNGDPGGGYARSTQAEAAWTEWRGGGEAVRCIRRWRTHGGCGHGGGCTRASEQKASCGRGRRAASEATGRAWRAAGAARTKGDGTGSRG